MKLGLIGLPGCGKTALFRALSRAEAAPGVPGTRSAAVRVPDERLEHLRRIFEPKKCTPASFDCADVTGLIKGTGGRSEPSAEMLARVRELDALVLVLRAFPDPGLPHPAGSVEAARDLAAIEAELVLADLEIAERRIEKLRVSVKKPTPRQKQDEEELALVEKIAAPLAEGRPVRALSLSTDEEKTVRGFRFLTAKPVLVVLNVGEDAGDLDAAAQAFAPPGTETLAISAKIEMEIAELPEDERGEFLSALGLSEPATPRLIRAAYRTLGLITFFTYVSGEVRAWTVPAGSTAVEAAGRIHSDMARGFIRAETVAFEDLKKHGEMKAVKAAGRLRVEGREYIVQDGDILTIRFSV